MAVVVAQYYSRSRRKDLSDYCIAAAYPQHGHPSEASPFLTLANTPAADSILFPHPQPKLAGKQTSSLRISQRFRADRKQKSRKGVPNFWGGETRTNSRFGRKRVEIYAWNESNILAIGPQVDEASTCACQMMLLFSFFLRYIRANTFLFLWLCSQRMRCSRRSSAIC